VQLTAQLRSKWCAFAASLHAKAAKEGHTCCVVGHAASADSCWVHRPFGRQARRQKRLLPAASAKEVSFAACMLLLHVAIAVPACCFVHTRPAVASDARQGVLKVLASCFACFLHQRSSAKIA
jgi:hypothetical protein